MCGRFSQSGNFEEIRKQCKVVECAVDEKPRYNIAPSQPAQVIFNDGSAKAAMFRWGLVPSWAKDEKIGNRLINARAESLDEKPAFKGLFRKKRCLIPVDGFYEWQKIGKSKQPVRILMKDDAPFALAGLWDRWTSPQGEIISTFTIITTEANELIKPIHDRMPVIIPPEKYILWLESEDSHIDFLKKLLKPYPAEQMRCYKVSKAINNPLFDTAECIRQVDNEGFLF